MLVHSLVQFLGACRLSKSNTSAAPEPIVTNCKSLIASLGICQKIDIRLSRLIEVPTLIGWLKPVILLPPAMVSGLSARELELILLHELIHIRRHDYLINVIQTVIESLLFYHPCVWWLSRQIRVEREFAADEQVVRMSRDRATYVQALLQLERYRSDPANKTSPALAATDGSLLLRVQRIVQLDAQSSFSHKHESQTNAFNQRQTHSLMRWARIPLVLIALPLLFTATFLLAAHHSPETELESKTMPRYSDNSKRSQPAVPSKSETTNKSKTEPNTMERPWRDGYPKTYSYANVDLSDPINQWQKAIEMRDADEVARLLKQHPEYANMQIMDRKRDGQLNTEDHHQEALEQVARTGHLEIAKLLVEAGANKDRICGALMIAESNVAEFLLEHCDRPEPDIGLMAYLGKWEAMQFWFDRGYKPEMQMLHDACCGRPSMRHFAARVDSDSNLWPLQYRETVRVLIEAGADVNERTLGGDEKWGGAKPWRKNRETPLHIAAASHDIVLIQQLLDAGADKTLKNDLGDTPFDWAIRYLAPSDVVTLLNFDGNPRSNPQLWNAAHAGDLETVKQLIESGADPNAVDANGSGTLLNFHPEVTRYLLEKGANPDIQRNENILPVLVGIAGFNTECLKVLLDGGADPDIAGHHNGETALHHSVCGDNLEQVMALLDAGADPNKRTLAGKMTYMLWRDARVRGETPLHRAAAYGTPEVIQLLLDKGADPTIQDANKDTPLSWASWHHRDKSIIDMLAYEGSGVGPDYPPADGKSVNGTALADDDMPRNDELVAAALNGNLEMVKELIEGGADPNSVDANGMGPLLNFHPEVTEYLLSKGADPNIQRNENILPVISGVCSNLECVRLMLEAGADVNRASDHNGETVLHHIGSDVDAIKMLLEAGADPNAQTIPGMRTYAMWRDVRCRGETPLHRNAAWGSIQSIKTLLEAGADPAIRDANGDSPLSWASWYMRDKSIIDLLSSSTKASSKPEADNLNDVRSTDHTGNPKSEKPENETAKMNFLPPDDPFIVAIREVDLPRIKEFIEHDKSLVCAHVRGSIDLTGKVWRDGKKVDVSEHSPEHAGALHFASFHGLSELAQVLIDLGADISAFANLGENMGGKSLPVTIAAWQGNKETLQVILQAAKTTGTKLELMPALSTALVHLSLEKAELLLEHGAVHDIYTAAMAGDATELKRLIETAPDSIDCNHSRYNCTPLEQALKVGQVEMAEILAKHGAKVSTPAAAAMGRVDQIKALLRDDPETATRRFDKQPLLIWATQGGQVEVVKLLLRHGSDPNGGDDWGVTPLRHVAQVQSSNGAAIVDLLVEAGADVNQVSRGYTPLESAKSNHHVEKRLIYHIENNIEVSELESKFWNAIGEGEFEVVKSCLGEESSLASKRFPTHNRTVYCTDGLPLHRACQKGHWEIAQLLLDHGADPDAKRELDEIGEHREIGMPLYFTVADHKNYRFAHFLLDHGCSPNSYPYCDQATISRVFYQAREAGLPSAVVRRAFASYLPDQATLETQSVADLVGTDAAESVRLFSRMADLGGTLPFVTLVREGYHDLAIEIVEHSHDKDGTPHDHPNSNVLDNITGAARWYGYPELFRRLMDHQSYRYSYEDTIGTIGIAISSHNRDGGYADYREIILMQLEELKSRGDLEKAQQDPNFRPLYHIASDFTWHNNYGYRAEIAKPECYIDLAELFVSWGFDNIEQRDPNSNHSPLSKAVARGKHPGITTYIRWLLEKGADLRQSDSDEVNPIAIARENEFDEIRKLLESYGA